MVLPRSCIVVTFAQGTGFRMGRFSGSDLIGTAARLGARLVALTAAGVLLANCSGGMSGKVDPRYGVASSARVVEPGEPVPKGGGTYRVGRPYVVGGRTYVPEENINYSAEGMASFYGDDFHGRYTANGEVFDMNSISAAHPTLPMPSYVRVTNLNNHRSLVVRVNDRGPYANDRIIDLSVQCAKLLGFYGHGLAKVRVDYVGRAPLQGSDDRKLMATLREGDKPVKSQPVMVASATKDYVPEFFDARPMTQVASRDIPAPQDRSYTLGDGAAPAATERSATVEMAANARMPGVQRAPLEAPASANAPSLQTERLTSPISAYAPARYDAPAGFMSGRGLY
jgi:rare lipoprotein A